MQRFPLHAGYPQNGAFDQVISVASIKHWPDRARGMLECVRVLRPGGALIVVEADRGCHLADAGSFIAGTRLPRPLLPVALAAFRTPPDLEHT